ncbi:hypothetical protein [Corynebacterium diphtheriae]|uniref:hypothetical protein n=1 Tax=Corynebacterium diphtheriae TaxID=1717 RepID=UPI00092A8F06|nr:hypothetical protein [Corynebacterium diphtheriae]OJI00918.1 hypothetical protein BJU21_05370 [Corynebacterium diphtheriae]OSQ09234.1 hypothetical protein B1A59_03735 [Corynebacterium diphtheriae]
MKLSMLTPQLILDAEDRLNKNQILPLPSDFAYDVASDVITAMTGLLIAYPELTPAEAGAQILQNILPDPAQQPTPLDL